jgi:hypothetical protein
VLVGTTTDTGGKVTTAVTTNNLNNYITLSGQSANANIIDGTLGFNTASINNSSYTTKIVSTLSGWYVTARNANNLDTNSYFNIGYTPVSTTTNVDFLRIVPTSATTSRTQFPNGDVSIGNAIIKQFSWGGTGAFDTGISVNAFDGGGSMIVIGSGNTSAGVNTNAQLYFLKLYYNGNNAPPALIYLGGDGSNLTVGMSASNTITFTASNAGNHNITLIGKFL